MTTVVKDMTFNPNKETRERLLREIACALASGCTLSVITNGHTFNIRDLDNIAIIYGDSISSVTKDGLESSK